MPKIAASAHRRISMNNCRTLDRMAASDLGECHEEGAVFLLSLDEPVQEMVMRQV